MRYLYIGYNDWPSLKKWGHSVKVRKLAYPFLRGQPLKCHPRKIKFDWLIDWLIEYKIYILNKPINTQNRSETVYLIVFSSLWKNCGMLVSEGTCSHGFARISVQAPMCHRTRRGITWPTCHLWSPTGINTRTCSLLVICEQPSRF